MSKKPVMFGPVIERVETSGLTPTEKDRLLDAIVEYLGLRIETSKWDGDRERSIYLIKRLR